MTIRLSLALVALALWALPVWGQSVDAKSVDTKSVDTKSVDTKSVDTKSVDTKQVAITSHGVPVTFDAMIETLGNADVVFVGENHDHALGHALELAILQGLHTRTRALALSLEMFERDVQLVLDEYLAGNIPESSFLQAARPWPNYRADYRPLVEFCKEQNLPVIAANAPRRYVHLVGLKGQASLLELPKASKTFLPPLPYAMDLPQGYDAQLTEIFTHTHQEPAGKSGPSREQTASSDRTASPTGMPSVEHMKQAQALWDATMQDSIMRFLRAHRGAKVLQMNGAMHSDSGYGIVDRLRKASPRLKVMIVTIKPDTAFPNLSPHKYEETGDFVIMTPRAEKPSPER